MKGYNLYYNSEKLNKFALTESEKDNILNYTKKIYRKNPITNKMDEINPSDIMCVKTTVIL